MGENGGKIKLKVQLGVCGVTEAKGIVLPGGKVSTCVEFSWETDRNEDINVSIGFNTLEATDDLDKNWGWKSKENSLEREYWMPSQHHLWYLAGISITCKRGGTLLSQETNKTTARLGKHQSCSELLWRWFPLRMSSQTETINHTKKLQALPESPPSCQREKGRSRKIRMS